MQEKAYFSTISEVNEYIPRFIETPRDSFPLFIESTEAILDEKQVYQLKCKHIGPKVPIHYCRTEKKLFKLGEPNTHEFLK